MLLLAGVFPVDKLRRKISAGSTKLRQTTMEYNVVTTALYRRAPRNMKLTPLNLVVCNLLFFARIDMLSKFGSSDFSGVFYAK